MLTWSTAPPLGWRRAFPFFAAENLFPGAMGIASSNGATEKERAEQEEMSNGGSAPSSFIAGEGQPAIPTITVMMIFLCMQQGLVKSGSCRGSVGKRRRPCPINRHASSRAAGYWGLWRSALALWLHLEAKSEHALGPRATVGVLGTGVPRLACLRPVAWLHQRPCTAHLQQQTLKTLARRMTQDLLRGSVTRLAREERRDQGKELLVRFP